MNCAARMKREANGECRLRSQAQNREQHGRERDLAGGEIHECVKRGEGVGDMDAVRTKDKK